MTEHKPYLCGRCNSSFQTADDLSKHFTSRTKVPCDRVCTKCGLKMNSDRTYLRHITKPCSPQCNKPIVIAQTNGGIQNVAINGNNNNVNVVINNNNIPIALGDITTYCISRMGVIPIEQEQPMLLDKHTASLTKLFMTHLKRIQEDDNANSDENLKTMLLTIIELFHSNKRYPEFMNIIEGDSETDLNLVYSATEFVNDLMPKLIRNKRVLQLLLDQLERYLKLGTNTPQLFHFIKDIFIPYIYNLYKTNNIPPEMQICWKNNKRVLEMINFQDFPIFPQDRVNYEIMDQQFTDYCRKDADIMRKISELNAKDIERIRREAMRRAMIEGKNLN